MGYRHIPTPPKPVHIAEFMAGDLKRCGVYFLFSQNICVYVGQSRWLKERLCQHLADRKKVFTEVAFIECTIDDLGRIESHYIRKYAPKYNNCGIAKLARLVNPNIRPLEAEIDLSSFKLVDAEHIMLNEFEAAESIGIEPDRFKAMRGKKPPPEMSVLDTLYFVAAMCPDTKKKIFFA